MSKPVTDWNSMESWKRLVTSIQATGVKIDLKETAKYFGTTEGALGWQFRSIKKDAKVLQGNPGGVISGGGTPSRTKSTASTPKSKTPKKDALHTVANGRVSKTPTKKGGIKKEPTNDDEDDAESLNGGGMGGVKDDNDIFSKFTYQDEEDDETTV